MNERKKKAMLVMPLIVAPFIVFIFWVLGLVGPAEAKASGASAARGININLPAAIPSADSSWDKLHFYEQADKDSAKLRQLRRQDPYLNDDKFERDPLKKYSAKARYQPYPAEALHEADEEERKVYEKIKAIHEQMEHRPITKKKTAVQPVRGVQLNTNKDVDRLERMMQMMESKDRQEDPEMQQIKQLMESIKDVQHPERVSERMKTEEAKAKVYEVSAVQAGDAPAIATIQGNRFYSMDDVGNASPSVQDISAVVHDEQTVASGDVVKLRLTQPVFVNNQTLAENSFVYGEAKVNGNRILVHVAYVQVQGKHLPVSLDVMGHDGMPGIPVRASKASMAAAQTVDRSAQGVDIRSVDHSLGAQIAGAAIQSGKQLLKKQTKLLRYTIPAGYTVQLVSAVN